MDIASALLAYLDSRSDAPDGLSSFLRSCPPETQRAALEVIAAAALDDGTLSASERAILEQREGDASAARVEGAIRAVSAMMPFVSDDDRRRFLGERGELIPSGDREHVLRVCVRILEDAAAPDVEDRVAIFASALGASNETVAAMRAR